MVPGMDQEMPKQEPPEDEGPPLLRFHDPKNPENAVYPAMVKDANGEWVLMDPKSIAGLVPG